MLAGEASKQYEERFRTAAKSGKNRVWLFFTNDRASDIWSVCAECKLTIFKKTRYNGDPTNTGGCSARIFRLAPSRRSAVMKPHGLQLCCICILPNRPRIPCAIHAPL